MLSHEALRQAAQTQAAVLVDARQLLDLLDAAERAPAKPKTPRSPKSANPDDETCARWLADHLAKTKPNAKKPSIGAWARDVRMMRELDHRTHREICLLFAWARADSFWHQNILCPAKLRKNWDQLESKRDAAGAQPVRETVDERNARLRAAFLSAPAASMYLQLEA